MTRLLLLSMLLGCGADETAEPESDDTPNTECIERAERFWSEVEQIDAQLIADPAGIANPVVAAEPSPLDFDTDAFRVVRIAIDSEMVKLEGHRLAPSEWIADGESGPVALTTQLDRMREEGPPIHVYIHADGSVAAGVLRSVLEAIGDRARAFVLAYTEPGDNPRTIPASFVAEVPRLSQLEGTARLDAVEAAARQATERCPAMFDTVKVLMQAVLPPESSARLTRHDTSPQEHLVACDCAVDFDELLAWYRASSLNRWGRLGAVSIESPSSASAWADKTIDDVVN